MDNPWRALPSTPPYALNADLLYLHDHRNFSNLVLDALPESTVGGLDSAEVIFLALNPGFTPNDIEVNLQLPGFKEANIANLKDPFGSPFYYFNGTYQKTGGYKWWTKNLKPLLRDGVDVASLKNKIMVMEYFPYHSKSYKHIDAILPSQRFTFELVREAIRRKKVIVIMRSTKLWTDAVPELLDYPYMKLSSVQNVVISPKNIGEDNYQLIKSILLK